MDDFKVCPICNNKLRTINNIFVSFDKINRLTSERNCTKGMNHSLQIHSDIETNKVLKIKVSLAANYSKFIEINYVLNNSTILCMKDGKINPINIDKVLEIDFQDLDKLRKKVDMLIAFS